MTTVKELKEKLRENDYDTTILSYEETELMDRVSNLQNHVGKLAKHFKGDLYLILDIVEHTETGDDLVIYKALYGDCKSYARPIDMFLSKTDKNKYPNVEQNYRFEFVEVKSVAK